jgi:hypothetical protein
VTRELLFTGDNHEDVLRHMAPHAMRGGFHPGAPGDAPKIQVQLADGSLVEVAENDLVIVDDDAATVEVKHLSKPR